MTTAPPDVLLVGPKWPERALLRAELIEAGYDVVAIDAWPIPRIYRRPGMTPRVVIVDLQGLPDPRTVLDELRFVMPSDRVLVITALGTVTVDEIRRIGYQVVTRPTSIRDVVAATTKLLRANGAFSVV
jgi:DNA-binding response OmpR family regulator